MAGPEAGWAQRLDGRLVGRPRERRLLDGLLESVEDGGAAVVITAEAGGGKTALLRHVADVAADRGVRVLRARGEESEAVLAFAAVADLLLPLREKFAGLPLAQRHALEVCLALSSGPAVGPLAACAGALGVLASAAAERPLAVLVDDFQWIDPESQQILLFAARRLAAERIVMLLAVRDEPGARLPGQDLPALRMGGLSVAECAELARVLGADISGPALRSLVELTGGNPLAMLENLAGAADATGAFEPGRLTLGAALENAWGRVFEELPEDTRHALFVVATDGISGGRHVAAALGALRLPLSALTAAERRGLVLTADGQIQLRHPLIRPVVVGRTPLWARVAACRALAGASGGYLRAWYLAAAATGPDDTAADALAAAAAGARARSGSGASARTWRRAAELTADHGTRAVRLLRAATDAHLAGDPGAAVAWCEEALRLCADPVFVAEVELLLGRARTWAGNPLPAFDGLIRAAAMIRPVDPGRAVALLAEAIVPATTAGRVQLARQVAQQIEELWAQTVTPAAGDDAPPTVLALLAEAFVLAGDLDRAARYRARAEALVASADLGAEQQAAIHLARGDIWAERYEQGRLRLGAVVDGARRTGTPAVLPLALGLSAELGWWTGQWAVAYADAAESLQWAREMSQAGLMGYGLSLLARIEAARGDRERCVEHVERAHRDSEPRGVGWLAICNAAALGLCALSRGELAVAIEQLERAWAAGEAAGLGSPAAIPFAGDLAEALARAGAAERAGPVLARLQDQADATGLVYPRAAAARARGILARDPAEATAWFATARSAYEIQPLPFELARTLLCEGEALRRARRPAAARRPLRHALAIFTGLGARPWAARAMTELAAAGVRNDTSTLATGALSPQELQVARAVGRGLNNVEAAAALFVSRKTVEAHLTRVYRKLGLRSRTELTRLMVTCDEAPR
ncbi:MAG TPA: LuxR family transcriptional regulator, partial [Streptosporangiaceae bacterium]|nr:LuxR family transcriptional regulator [Streptosporangiaceae bacterium]